SVRRGAPQRCFDRVKNAVAVLTELLTRAYPCPPLTPRSTVCGLFARFRKSGLSWPLPAGMSEQELDALLY
ncbi:TPA: hypothetical protein ACHU8Z_004676, partial [Shigella flexneri]